VLKVQAPEHLEEWWSARDGATGRWRGCADLAED
jgi:hypothetical protein